MEEIKIISGNNEFIFDNIGDPVGFEYPTTRTVFEDVGGEHSAEYITSKFGQRPLSFRSLLLEHRIDEYYDMQKCLAMGGLKTLKFSPRPYLDLQTEVEIVNFTSPYRHGRRPMLIEAKAADWRFYAQQAKEKTIYATVISGGMSIPATVPYAITSAGGLNNKVQNLGTERTPPVFTIYGPGNQFVVSNEQTGASFTITYTLDDNDYITVSTDKGGTVIMLNNLRSIYSSFAGNYFNLIPGLNDIIFFPVGGSSNTRLKLWWRDAFIGI